MKIQKSKQPSLLTSEGHPELLTARVMLSVGRGRLDTVPGEGSATGKARFDNVSAQEPAKPVLMDMQEGGGSVEEGQGLAERKEEGRNTDDS